jgi:hypothetical protein
MQQSDQIKSLYLNMSRFDETEQAIEDIYNSDISLDNFKSDSSSQESSIIVISSSDHDSDSDTKLDNDATKPKNSTPTTPVYRHLPVNNKHTWETKASQLFSESYGDSDDHTFKNDSPITELGKSNNQYDEAVYQKIMHEFFRTVQINNKYTGFTTKNQHSLCKIFTHILTTYDQPNDFYRTVISLTKSIRNRGESSNCIRFNKPINLKITEVDQNNTKISTNTIPGFVLFYLMFVHTK